MHDADNERKLNPEGRNDGKGKHYMPQPFYGGGIKMKFFENIELCVLC